MFKLVVSPTEFFSMKETLDSFVHGFMADALSRAGVTGKGEKADWLAYVHTNTANPHIHILLRGQTVDGRDLFLPKSLIRNLRVVGATRQDLVTGGMPLSDEILKERTWASRVERMSPVYGASIDTFIEKLPNRVAYEAALNALPHFRRKALHARLIFLEKTGLVALMNGEILKPASFLLDFRRVRQLQRELLERGAFVYNDGARFSLENAASAVPLGLVTGVHSTRNHGMVAVFEAVDGSVIATRVAKDEVESLRLLAKQRALVALRGKKIEQIVESPKERLTKLSARGAVVDAILRG